jgi:hypothetical protein
MTARNTELEAKGRTLFSNFSEDFPHLSTFESTSESVSESIPRYGDLSKTVAADRRCREKGKSTRRSEELANAVATTSENSHIEDERYSEMTTRRTEAHSKKRSGNRLLVVGLA